MAAAALRFARECIPSLPRSVWILQLGNAVNFFGFGLILPFEILYLHEQRGISVPVAGLVLSTVMLTSSVVAGPSGTLVDRYGGKRLIGIGVSLSALGYAGFAFVTNVPSAFAAAIVAGTGAGLASAATPSLMAALTTREERAAAFSFSRIPINAGIGAGALVGGLIVAGGGLRSYQVVYLLDAITFLGFLLFLRLVPDARSPHAGAAKEHGGYSAVLRDRPFIALLVANLLWVAVAYAFYAALLGPYTREVGDFGAPAIGVALTANTVFIIIAQLPVTRLARSANRLVVLRLAAVIWVASCLAMIPAARLSPEWLAVVAVAVVGIAFGTGECLHAVAVGPLATDIARPELMGRYMALFALSWSFGIAAGPATGGALLAAGTSLPWIGGAALLALTFPVLGWLRHRLPEDVQATAPALAD